MTVIRWVSDEAIVTQGPPIELWHGMQRQIVRFCVMNLRHSGQASRAIYALNRIIFHHGLFAPDSIIGSLIYHHQTPDSMTRPHHFPDSTNRIGFSCSLLISHLPRTQFLMFTGLIEKVIVIAITRRVIYFP